MYINRIKLKNFKCFDEYSLNFNEKLNILVGNNDVGKSTIIEAIHLCLTGVFQGRYLKNNLSQDIFNNKAVIDYIDNIRTNKTYPLPECFIEIYLSDADPLLEGKENSEDVNEACISYSIKFNSKYEDEYKTYLSMGEIVSLPIEYYDVEWKNSADRDITGKSLSIKSVLIDTSESNLRTGPNTYISKIVKDSLEEKELIEISQLYRNARDIFINNEIIKGINKKLSIDNHILNSKIEIDSESLNRNDWEKAIITKINEIPFEYIGKGVQSAIKIELSINNKKSTESSVILIEEPENHLSHTKMSRLLDEIVKKNEEKQIFVTTHSSFVANKLNIQNMILLDNKKYTRFNDLNDNTKNFFLKKPGYDTLRLLLSQKAILVEGDSDELVVQRAYLDKYKALPIEKEVEVISIGTSFLRFLELAEKLEKKVVVITDNDGDINALESKYAKYLGNNKKTYIDILYDNVTHKNQGNLKSENGGDFNYDTLEPCLLRANNKDVLDGIFSTKHIDDDSLIKYMVNNKTDCALKIFDSKQSISYPKYIEDAIND